jgi:AhpD family alkylhydroperoxidase
VSEPRIPPGGRGELGPVTLAFSRLAGRAMRTERPPNLFTTLGRHGGLFWGWLMFAGRLMPGGKLPRRETELVILRVAHLRGCAYEFDHHVRLGRRAGVGVDDVARVIEGPAAEGWGERERAILTAVDELHERRDIGDEQWAELSRHLSPKLMIELTMLVGHYEMLATTIQTLRIETDRHPG